MLFIYIFSRKRPKPFSYPILYYTIEEEDIVISPRAEYLKREFNPIVKPNMLKGVGMFANDFAYQEILTRTIESYSQNNAQNLLMLVWRVSMDDGSIKPMNPVLVTRRDVTFENSMPMELGLHYSWSYWSATIQRKY